MPSTRSSSIKSIIRIIHPGSSAKAKRQQVVVFPTNVVVPHVATCETQQRPFSFVTPKEFCNKSARSGHASFGPRSLSRQLRCRSAQPTINAVAADPLIKARFAGLGVDPMSRRPRSEAHCRRNREVGQHHPASTSRQSEAESPFRECVPMTVMGHLRHFLACSPDCRLVARGFAQGRALRDRPQQRRQSEWWLADFRATAACGPTAITRSGLRATSSAARAGMRSGVSI